MGVRSENSELAVSPEVLNERIKTHVEGNWLHGFEVDAEKDILAAESYSYRWRILEPVFASLFYDRSVLVLDEASGIYPALVSRAGARVVSASSPNQRTCDLISEVTDYLEAPTNVVRSKMVAFYEDEPYVDMDHGGGHEFLLALGQVWPMFDAAGQDFDALVEACAFFVTDGIVLDWTNAEWATPPPPEHYDIEGLCDALRLKFDYVIFYDNWLVVATGKLPTGDEPAPPARAPRPVRRRRPAAKDPQKAAYRQFLPRFREVVCRAIPPDGTAIVVSKGDEALLNLEGRTAWHFPQGEDGDYAGYYPATSGDAIEHLEDLRARGGDFLVFAEPALWWLEHYEDFRVHLESRYATVIRDDETCVIFDVRATTGNTS